MLNLLHSLHPPLGASLLHLPLSSSFFLVLIWSRAVHALSSDLCACFFDSRGEISQIWRAVSAVGGARVGADDFDFHTRWWLIWSLIWFRVKYFLPLFVDVLVGCVIGPGGRFGIRISNWGIEACKNDAVSIWFWNWYILHCFCIE